MQNKETTLVPVQTLSTYAKMGPTHSQSDRNIMESQCIQIPHAILHQKFSAVIWLLSFLITALFLSLFHA